MRLRADGRPTGLPGRGDAGGIDQVPGKVLRGPQLAWLGMEQAGASSGFINEVGRPAAGPERRRRTLSGRSQEGAEGERRRHGGSGEKLRGEAKTTGQCLCLFVCLSSLR